MIHSTPLNQDSHNWDSHNQGVRLIVMMGLKTNYQHIKIRLLFGTHLLINGLYSIDID